METLNLDRAIAAPLSVLSQHSFLCFSCYRSTFTKSLAVLSQHLPCFRSGLSQHSTPGWAPVLSQHFHLNVWLCYRSTLFRAAPVLSQQFNYFGCAIAALCSGLPLCYRSISINRRIFGCAIAALCYGSIAARN